MPATRSRASSASTSGRFTPEQMSVGTWATSFEDSRLVLLLIGEGLVLTRPVVDRVVRIGYILFSDKPGQRVTHADIAVHALFRTVGAKERVDAIPLMHGLAAFTGDRGSGYA